MTTAHARVRRPPVRALEIISVVVPTGKALHLLPRTSPIYERFVPREEKIHFLKLYRWLTRSHNVQSALKKR
jgi:hypothetical protein